MASRLGKPEPLKGVTVIDSERSLIAGYGWMTQLLPYVGEEQRYQKFNFKKPWSDKVNLQLTGPVEAFLNPADPREAWEGWPYDGIGLTHFVGISGIEEARNDVAALLPRSDPKAGMFGYEEIARPAQITDGTSQTLMLMGSGTLAAPWVQGGGSDDPRPARAVLRRADRLRLQRSGRRRDPGHVRRRLGEDPIH